ncbi:MAG: hypothetical protein IKW09_00395 [Alphaproteobacteria bacterium]|nr:hypothetical protein [Alphaproteobacteria bacterium]
MKKTWLFFICGVFMAQNAAMGAITIKKAAPVSTKQTSVADTGASLVPTVLGLVSNIQQLTQKQKALTAECSPTTQEIDFVNATVKEWAKTGASTANEVQTALGMKRCSSPSGGYQASVRVSAGTDADEMICYDYFDDKDMVWFQFPKVVKTYYCTDGSLSGCSEKNRQEVSNIYDVFNLVDFVEADYTPAEATMAAKLISKIEQCSYSKLNAKKKAMWGEFLIDTIGSVGQKTNTAAIMQTVGGVANSGGMGALQSLGGIASQFMDR